MVKFLISVTWGALLAIVITAAGPADNTSWQAFVKETQDGYVKGETAVMKLADVVYLKEGQFVGIRCAEGKPAYRCKLNMSGYLDSVIVRNQEGKANIEQTADSTAVINITEGGAVDIGRGLTLLTSVQNDRVRVGLFAETHPALASFKGVEFFDYDPKWRIDGTLVRLKTPKKTMIATSRGLTKKYYKVGYFEGEYDGTVIRLPLFINTKNIKADSFALIHFSDASNGTETYGAGRYISHIDLKTLGDAEKRGATSVAFTLDFNFAYNPLCAVSPHYNCPLVKNSDVAMPVLAGAKAPAGKFFSGKF